MEIRQTLTRLKPTRSWAIWTAAAVGVYLGFDIMWCLDTGRFTALTDYSSLYVFLLIAAGITSLPSLFGLKKTQLAVLIAVAALLVANLMYAATYYVAIPLDSYLLAGNLTTIGPAIADSLKWWYLILPAIPVIAFFADRKPKRGNRNSRLIPLCGLAIVIMLGIVMLAGRGGFRQRMELMNRNGLIAPVYTVYASLIYDRMSTREELTPEMKAEVDQWMDFHRRLTEENPTPNQEKPARQKLVFILVESLESWPLETNVGGHAITPNLNKLLTDTAAVSYFPNVLTQTRDGRSIDAQLLYLTGRLPLKSGVFSMKYPTLDYQSLPKYLKEATGASATLFSPDPATMWNQTPIARAFGFDRIYTAESRHTGNPSDYAPDGYIFDKPMIQSTLTQADSILDAGKPAMLMWVTHTSHTPFIAPEGYTTPAAATVSDATLRNYITTIAYTDEALGMLLDHIASRPDRDEITVVIAGDHEGLASDRPRIAGNYRFVSPMRYTPLIIVNGPRNGRDDKTIGQVDVFTMLLDVMLPATATPWRGMGISAYSESHPGAAASPGDKIVGKPVSDSIAAHLRDAYIISDRMMRHSMVP